MQKLLLVLLCLMLPLCACAESALHAPEADLSYGTPVCHPAISLPFAALLPGVPMETLYEDEASGTVTFAMPGNSPGALIGKISSGPRALRDLDRFPTAQTAMDTVLFSPDGTQPLMVLPANTSVYVVGRTMTAWLAATPEGLWGSIALGDLLVDTQTAAALHELLPNAAQDGYELCEWQARYNLLQVEMNLVYGGFALMPLPLQVEMDDLAWRIGIHTQAAYAITPDEEALTYDEAVQTALLWMQQNAPEALDGMVGAVYCLERATMERVWQVMFMGQSEYQVTLYENGLISGKSLSGSENQETLPEPTADEDDLNG